MNGENSDGGLLSSNSENVSQNLEDSNSSSMQQKDDTSLKTMEDESVWEISSLDNSDNKKMAFVHVFGIEGQNEDEEDEEPHLFEFKDNGEIPTIQKMAEAIIGRLPIDQQNKGNWPPYKMLKLVKKIGKYGKVDPNSRVEDQGEYKLKFCSSGINQRKNATQTKENGLQNGPQQIPIGPGNQSSSSTFSHQEDLLHQHNAMKNSLKIDGTVDFDVLIKNLDEFSLKSADPSARQFAQIIKRQLECVQKGKAKCSDFDKFVQKMDECFSENNLNAMKQFIENWKEWTNVKAKQLWKCFIEAKGTNFNGLEMNEEILAEEAKFDKKFNSFCEEGNKLIPQEILNKQTLVSDLEKKGIPFIGRSFHELAEKLRSQKSSYVFFHEKAKNEMESRKGQQNYELFEKLWNDGECCLFVDLTVGAISEESREYSLAYSHITLFEGVSIIVGDYLEAYNDQRQVEMKEHERKINTCMVRIRDKLALKRMPAESEQQMAEDNAGPSAENALAIKKADPPSFLSKFAISLFTPLFPLLNAQQNHLALLPTNGQQPTENIVIPLELPCPLAYDKTNDGNIQCPNEDSHWECDDCGQIVCLQMPKDNSPIRNFYCGCGYAPITELTFRCKNSNLHGPDFAQFDPNLLLGFLERFQKFKEKNILILGETGVGKSTFINALANMVTYSTLDEAMQAEKPKCLIPAQFSLADEQMRPRCIRICRHGVRTEPECAECKKTEKDSNENFVGAKSATQNTMGHTINGIKGGRLRIIDTPGIGDTDGIKQDKKNIQNILNYIATLEEIHCICILLKPNNSRLTVLFRYCIQELLSSLHKNAAKNIIFCFTNSRGTLYKPGDTLTPLNIELDELEQKTGVRITVNPENTYCVDNEAFRFLCAQKANLKFTDGDYKNFSESWQRSQQEFNRMLNYVNDKLEPHCTKETTSVNEARSIITAMAKPLALISRNIQSNIAKTRDETERLAGLDTEAADFQSQLKIQRFYIENIKLAHPRTVCVAKEHTEVQKDKDGNKQTVYKTHCHSHCYLTGVAPDTFPNTDILQCWAMSGNNCHQCGCLWSVHMHIWYEQMEKSEWIDDAEVKRMLDNNANKKAIQQKAIENAQKAVKEWEAEQTCINNFAARAGAFLKKNSIVPINDAVEQYLKLLIREAKREADDTDKDYRRMDGLQESLNIYLEEKNILEKSIKAENSSSAGMELFKAEDIKKLRNQLFRLKLSGKMIKELFEAEKEGQNSQRVYQETIFNRELPRRASNNSHTHTNYQRFGHKTFGAKHSHANPYEYNNGMHFSSYRQQNFRASRQSLDSDYSAGGYFGYPAAAAGSSSSFVNNGLFSSWYSFSGFDL